MSKKSQKQIIDDYDYLANAASATDCTGLIPASPVNQAELESYNETYRFLPPVKHSKKDFPKK